MCIVLTLRPVIETNGDFAECTDSYNFTCMYTYLYCPSNNTQRKCHCIHQHSFAAKGLYAYISTYINPHSIDKTHFLYM